MGYLGGPSSSNTSTWVAPTTANLRYLPNPGAWPVTPKDTINDSASKADQLLNIAADNSYLKIIYGTVTIGAQIACVLVYQGSLVVLAVWGHGEVDSISTLLIDDKALVPTNTVLPGIPITYTSTSTGTIPTVTATHYIGTLTQDIDPTLVAAFAPTVYNDTLPGICYSVIKVPPGSSSGFPRLTAKINGRKVYDPRQNLVYPSTYMAGRWVDPLGVATITGGVNDPWGGTTAMRWNLSTATMSLLRVNTFSDIVLAAGQPYTVSFWCKKISGSGAISSDIGDEATLLIVDYSSQLVVNQWVRVQYTGTPTANRSFVDLINNTTNIMTLEFAGLQINAGMSALTYTKTISEPINPITAWSSNPALCLADFCTNTTYGMGKMVNWNSVIDTANECDFLIGTNPDEEPRRKLDLALDTVQTVQNWLDTLRTYAGCWVTTTSTGLYFIPDKLVQLESDYTGYVSDDYVTSRYFTTPKMSFNHADGSILSISNLKKRGIQSIPTVMIVTYKDVTGGIPRDNTAIAYAGGLTYLPVEIERRESEISLLGINRYSQAKREAIERLNKLTLNDLSCTLSVFDEGLLLDIGDVISVTHPIGLSNKLMRVMGISGEYGRYTLNLIEYDDNVYSNEVESIPKYPDTNLPNLLIPPVITGITVDEALYKQQSGVYTSRWVINWDEPEDANMWEYLIKVEESGNIVFTGSPTFKEAPFTGWASPPIVEGKTYSVQIATKNKSTGLTSEWSMPTSATAAGKTMEPDFSGGQVYAFEAGGTVYISWTPAIDIDIWKYEVRYASSAIPWDSRILIDKIDSLRIQTDQIPVGHWIISVRAIDSVNNYSDYIPEYTVNVTSDASAFLVDTKYHNTIDNATNMPVYTLDRIDTNKYYITEDNVLWDTKYSSVSGLNSYTSPLATYHNSMTSTWLGGANLDYGQELSGQWTGVATVTDISGVHNSYFGSSPDMSIWTYLLGLSQKLKARGVRLKHEALNTSTMLVTLPNQYVRLDAVPREESGVIISTAGVGATVLLYNTYSSVKSIQLTAQSNILHSATYDNIQINGYAANPMDPTGNITLGSEVLQLSTVLPIGSTGNSYNYCDFSNTTPSGYLVQSGGYLKFDYLKVSEPTSGNQSLILYNGVWGSGTVLVWPYLSGTVGIWNSISIPIISGIGLGVTHCALVMESDTPGTYTTLLRNVRITDSAGSLRKSLWRTGKPTMSSWLLLNYSLMQGNRANAFDVFAFNQLGASVGSIPIQYIFKGV